jgi:hypothetical protein
MLVNQASQLARLNALQAEVDQLRKQLGLAAPDQRLFDDQIGGYCILVLTDGFGAYKALIIRGHYPDDYTPIRVRNFARVSDALMLAHEWVIEILREMEKDEEKDICWACGEIIDDLEGYDGLCGDCADRADSAGYWDNGNMDWLDEYAEPKDEDDEESEDDESDGN